jgi:hypothetical protein
MLTYLLSTSGSPQNATPEIFVAPWLSDNEREKTVKKDTKPECVAACVRDPPEKLGIDGKIVIYSTMLYLQLLIPTHLELVPGSVFALGREPARPSDFGLFHGEAVASLATEESASGDRYHC